MLKFVVQLLLVYYYTRNNARRKHSWASPSSFLLLIYLLAALLSIPTLYIEDYTQPFESRYWVPVIQFLFFLFCFIHPFCQFNEAALEKIILPSKKILDIFSTFIIVISFFSIFHFSVTVSEIFRLESLEDARNALYEGELYVESGILTTIASVGASMYVFALMLFFVYRILGKSKRRSVLLLIASISEPLHVLSFVGRDGVVFWLFSFIFLYCFFKPFLSDKQTRNIQRQFIIGSLFLLIPFIAISISRFDDSSAGTEGSLISYMGQSFVNGPLFMGIEDKPFKNGACFPLFFEITGMEMVEEEAYEKLVQIGEWRSWTFGTFITSLYMYIGFKGMAFICISMFIIFKTVFRGKNKVLKYGQLFIYILYFQIFSQGVFYFRQGTRGANLFIVLCFLLYFAFSILIGKNHVEIRRIAPVRTIGVKKYKQRWGRRRIALPNRFFC